MQLKSWWPNEEEEEEEREKREEERDRRQYRMVYRGFYSHFLPIFDDKVLASEIQ